jgi:hypothetical protein
MIKTEPIDPKLFRVLVHGKAARAAAMIAEAENIPYLEALRKFYFSKTYQDLETEETKTWWESPAQIFNDYCQSK